MKKPSIAGFTCRRVLEIGNILKKRILFLRRPVPFLLVLLTPILLVPFGYLGWRFGVVLGNDHNFFALVVSLMATTGTAWTLLLLITRKLGGSRKSQIHPPSLNRVSNFADFWGLGLRKRIKAIAGEFDVEVKRLHKEKRFRMAKWNVVLAWGYSIWYVLRGPYDLMKGALVKAMKGL
jgi:hypothetical protein